MRWKQDERCLLKFEFDLKKDIYLLKWENTVDGVVARIQLLIICLML